MRIRNTNLTEGSIWKQVLLFSIPLVLSNLLQQLYNAADLMIVGRYAGELEMAAVGATGSITSMIIGLFLGLATGCSVVIAQYYGRDDYDNLQNSVHTSYAIAIVGGLGLTILGYFSSPILLELMGTPKQIFSLSVTYMRIFFAGSVPLLIYNMGSGIMRSIGDSRRPFYFLIVSAVTNIVLDLVFVLGFSWGVVGAGWATVISQAAAAVLVTYSLHTTPTSYQIQLKKIRFHGKALKEIVKIGVPAGLQSMLISFSNVLIQTQVNSFGSDAIAGVAVATRIDGLIFSVLDSFSLSATTFAGQNIGAGLKSRIERGAKEISVLTFLSTLFIGILVFIFRYQLVGLFSNSNIIIEHGARMIAFLAPLYWLLGLANMLGGYIRGSGESLIPMLIYMFGMCVFRIVYLYVGLSIEHSLDLVYICYPLSWVVTLVIMVIYYFKGNWKKALEV